MATTVEITTRHEEDPEFQALTERLRAASGNVKRDDPMVTFFYLLLQKVSSAALAKVLLEVPHIGIECAYGNGYDAQMAMFLAEELRAKFLDPEKPEAPSEPVAAGLNKTLADGTTWEGK